MLLIRVNRLENELRRIKERLWNRRVEKVHFNILVFKPLSINGVGLVSKLLTQVQGLAKSIKLLM